MASTAKKVKVVSIGDLLINIYNEIILPLGVYELQ